MILAGDIGGTNTRLALFDSKGELKIIAEEKYPSGQYSSLLEIVRLFQLKHSAKILAASFGIAGPVHNGRCQATNLPWMVDENELSTGLEIPSVRLYNDLQANAKGLQVLKSEELYCLQEGKRINGLNPIGHQALIAAGTGLGEAGLFWDGVKHQAFACEGGHTDFAPRDELESELLTYLQEKLGHVSYERVVSGPGIRALYQFLVDCKGEVESTAVIEEMERRDPSSVISEFALKKKDPLCEMVIDWFLSIYGAESGNMALKFLSLGGVYIGGGIAPRLLKLFKESSFLTSFSNKGRFKPLLQSIPIYIVLNDHAALLGAAVYGRELV